ncbi:MAG: hypothetical protein OXU61_03185, partial [Gammaproteobacteria bacterium]|nr:hypothetical protein [Gammaproteobacteria bacterium]
MDTITINVEDAGAAPVGPAPPTTPPPNLPPVAEAGPDQTVDEATTPQVTLDGRGSSDPEGERLAYCWTQTSGTAVGPFVGTVADARDSCGPAGSYQSANVPVVSFSTDLVASSTLVFQLVVTVPETRDEDGNVLRAAQVSAADTVTVTVTADDDMPIVEAGDSSQRVVPGVRVALLGAYARDDGGPPAIEWSQTGGTTVTLSSATALRPTFTAPALTAPAQSETLTFQLQATETGGAMRSVTDTVEVVVANNPSEPAPPGPPIFEVNAGPDQTVAGGAAVTLDGSASQGSVSGVGAASATDWTWTQVSGTTVTRTAPCASGCRPSSTDRMVNHFRQTFTAPSPSTTEVLVFKLSRAQGGQTKTDTVSVTVTGSDPTATPPTVTPPASPGERGVSFPTVNLTATTTASSPTWQWWQVSGPPAMLVNETTATVQINLPSVAAYDAIVVFAVAVTSGGVTSAPGLVSFRFNAGNPAPRASSGSLAGDDVELAEGASTTLGASSLNNDGDSHTIEWTQYGGPRVALSNPAILRPTFTAPTSLVATTFFYYQILVTDEHGAFATDEVRIQVNGANAMPMASAGTDQTVDEDDLVTLMGEFSDDEGIATVEWEHTGTADISAYRFLTSLNTARPRFVPAQAYSSVTTEFTITVTDLQGGTATDTVAITINADNDAPRAVTCILPKIRVPSPTDADPAMTVEVPQPGARCAGQDVGSGASVTLEGRDSSDPEGEQLSYAWEQVTRSTSATPPMTMMPGDTHFSYTAIAQDDPNRVTLTGAATAQPSFTAPTAAGDDIELFFRLTVTEMIDPGTRTSLGLTNLSGSAVTGVAVRARPAADAGADQNSYEGGTVTLDGSASAPSNIPGDTGALSYAWSQVGGTPTVTLSDSAAESPTFTVPALSAETMLTFRLTVTDSMGNSGTDETQVRLLPLFNVAVSDSTVGEGESVSLSLAIGDENVLPNAERTYTYEWEQTAGPDVLTPTGADARTFLFRAPTPLAADAAVSFRVTVTATDDVAAAAESDALMDATATKTATAQVTVTAASAGARPTADAGSDQTA